METTDPAIRGNGSMTGAWRWFDSAAGLYSPNPLVMSTILGGRGTSLRALHVTVTNDPASAYNGVMIGLDSTYNVSAYRGFRFWARVNSGSDTFIVTVPDVYTTEGYGYCMNVSGYYCRNHLGKSVTIDSTWREYTVLFSELRQLLSGPYYPHSNLDESRIVGFQWAWRQTSMNLWVDDVTLLQ